MGRRARRAGVHPRQRPRRPPHEVLPRARGGEVPVAARGAGHRALRRRDRRHHRAHRGPARVLGRRGRLPRDLGVARRGRDRERAAVRGDAPARDRARAARRARRGDRARRRARGARPDRGRPRPPAARRAGLPRVSPRLGQRGARAHRQRPRAGGSAADTRPGRAGPGARPRWAERAPRRPARRERRADRPARRRGERARGARARHREPGRGRDQEGSGHRAAHGEEPDQGLLRGARRRAPARRPRRARRPSRLRPRPAARRPRRRARRRRVRAGDPRRCDRVALRPARGLAARARQASHAECGGVPGPLAQGAVRAREPRLRRHLERLPGRGRLRGRLCRGSAGAPRDDRADRPARASSPTRSSARTSTSCGSRSTAASAMRPSTPSNRLAEYDAQRGSQLVHDARGVPAPPRLDQRDLGGALRPSEHAPPAPAPHRGAVRPRPPPRRLAHDRDRREDGEAPASARNRRNRTHSRAGRCGGPHLHRRSRGW